MASLPVRGERATRAWRRALSEAGGDTVLVRPEAQLSGRARGVVLIANDAAKRRSGCPPRHSPMYSLNSTSRVRPVRRCGLREVSGGVRSAGAGRFRLDGVPVPWVPCRRLRSPPRLLGGSFWDFSVGFGRAKHHLRGRGVFVGGVGGLGGVVDKRKCRVSIRGEYES